MDGSVTFGTDTATLAVFDAQVLASRLDDESDWWCGSFAELREVQAGHIAVFGLGGDGIFKVRVTDGELSAAERAYASEVFRQGVVVESGHVFVGPGEELPSEGMAPRWADPSQQRFFVAIPPDSYDVEAFGIDWRDSPDWYTAPGRPIPEAAPADVVLRFVRRVGTFSAPTSEPRLFVATERVWLFPDQPRRLGPTPGMVLTTRVVRRRDDLVLKPCGPLQYRPVVDGMSGLTWQDEIDVRVVSVDHARQEFAGTIVARRASAG